MGDLMDFQGWGETFSHIWHYWVSMFAGVAQANTIRDGLILTLVLVLAVILVCAWVSPLGTDENAPMD